MKISRQLPGVSPINPQERREVSSRNASLAPRTSETSDTRLAEATANSKSTSFSLQLNQQLSSMQSADSFLGDLHSRLSQLKLVLSQQISSPPANGEETVQQAVRQVEELLQDRSKRTANSLDATFNLMQRSPSSYAAVTQTVVAQATLSRYAVVSLLS